MRRRPRRVLVAVVLLALSAGVAAFAAADDEARAVPYVVDIRIHYSRFEPRAFSVPRDRPVRFVIRNDDPIGHEWIVGDETVHEVHRTGTEPHHASRPTEISIPPLSTRQTTITFEAPVNWQFICHLPGHEAYGMVGSLAVR